VAGDRVEKEFDIDPRDSLSGPPSHDGPGKAGVRTNVPTAWILAGALCVFVLYWGLNTSFTFHFAQRSDLPDYQLLADALLSGQLHLNVEVDPRRLSSPDPLDPRLPYPFLMDGVIFQGRYHFPHEPFPAVLRVLFMLLTGISYSTGAIVLVLCTLNVLLLAYLLVIVERTFPDPTGGSLKWIVLFSFVLSQPQLYTVAMSSSYYEATTLGCTGVLAGTLFTLIGASRRERGMGFFLAAGCCFGVAVGSRAVLVVYPIVSCVGLLIWFLAQGFRPRIAVKMSVVLGLPVILASCLLLAYNFARFGDALDFGRSYGISGSFEDYLHLNKGKELFRLSRVPIHLYHYLLAPPDMSPRLPWLRFPWYSETYGSVYAIREIICSVFILVPALLSLFFAPFSIPRLKCLPLTWFACLLCLAGSAAMLGVLSLFVRAAARYTYDFVPILFVPIFCILSALRSRLREKPLAMRLLSCWIWVMSVSTSAMGILMWRVGSKQW
jgi:hypothetical protein